METIKTKLNRKSFLRVSLVTFSVLIIIFGYTLRHLILARFSALSFSASEYYAMVIALLIVVLPIAFSIILKNRTHAAAKRKSFSGKRRAIEKRQRRLKQLTSNHKNLYARATT